MKRVMCLSATAALIGLFCANTEGQVYEYPIDFPGSTYTRAFDISAGIIVGD